MTTPAADELGRILIIIPTYNEAENVVQIVTRARSAVPQADVLVADDHSPDGTGKLADELAAADEQVHVMHRLGKEGLGAAYLAGFEWGINAGYDVLVEMDADGSHQPEQLPLLLAALVDADLVLGSRWVKGGQVVNWPKSREFLSQGRQPVDPDGPGHPASGTPPAVTAPSDGRPCSASAWTMSPRRATASRSISPGGPSRPVIGSSRCRSPSWSESAATRR